MAHNVNWPLAVASVGLPILGGWTSGLFTRQALATYYKNLKKPSWTPPPIAFPIAWTTLYATMGYASFRVLARLTGYLPLTTALTTAPMLAYFGQLVLNFSWTPLFFVKRRPDLAMIDITLLNLGILYTAHEFVKVDRLAGKLLIPYWLWVSFAGTLNFWIWRNNQPVDKKLY
ncbi:peripheral-type benzodiazepine receptor [Planoprotostelium fungivorum]|uniref:Peripheral-type benzodiazepine receptor n=1 Tax=Planoprotostelium fungivorum TaxID=1890364 RepID=A0A2P6ND92_9EUKA|nr:peripheral-type benzodiazepine receptor [Planoprotostelium fungivorum]